MKTLHTYIIGFVISIGLTLAAFGLVYYYLSAGIVALLLVVLAIAQLLVQLVLFLSGIFIIGIWALIHYEIRLPKKKGPAPIDCKAMLEALIQSTEPLDMRLKKLMVWTKVALSQQYGRSFLELTVQEIISRLESPKKEQMAPFLLDLERAEFQPEQIQEDAWQQLVQQARTI